MKKSLVLINTILSGALTALIMSAPVGATPSEVSIIGLIVFPFFWIFINFACFWKIQTGYMEKNGGDTGKASIEKEKRRRERKARRNGYRVDGEFDEYLLWRTTRRRK